MFPLMFVVLRSAWKDSTQFLSRLCQIREFSFKRLLCKFFLIFLIPTALLYSGYCLKIYVSRVCSFSSTFGTNISYIEQSIEIKNLVKIIPPDERDSFMTWELSGNMARWILETDMRPASRFFYNQRGLSKLDPSVRKEWFEDVEKNNTLWILYGGKLKTKALSILTSPEDADVEKLLSEKYVYRGEVSLYSQDLKLYRLKE